MKRILLICVILSGVFSHAQSDSYSFRSKKITVVKDSIQDLQLLSLHDLAGLNFVIPEPAIKGLYKTIKGKKEENPLDKLVFDVTAGNETKQMTITGGQYNIESPTQISVGGLHFRVNYGCLLYTSPSPRD